MIRKTTFSVLTAFIVFLFVNNLKAQDLSPTDEIKKIMSKDDKAQLAKAEKTFKEGDAKAKEGNDMLALSGKLREQANNAKEKDKKSLLAKADKQDDKAYRILIKASENYGEANKVFYNLYKKNLKELAKKSDENKKSQVAEVEKDADDLYKQALVKRKKAASTDDNAKAYKLCADADQNEADAISVQIQAFSIYLDWFKDDGNKTKDNKTDGTKTEVSKTDNNTNNEIKTDIPVTDVNKNNETNTNTNTKTENNQNTEIISNNTNNQTDNQKTQITKQTGIVYKVQIAASKVPLSIEKLRQIYPSNEIINNEKEGDWYKYSVGYYSSYEKAYEAKKKMGVAGSFIVAYKDGTKVKDITEVCTPTDHPAIHMGQQNTKTGDIEFRIQIAVSASPLTTKEAQTYNKTQYPVQVYQDTKYKYTVGNFKTADEAKLHSQSVGYTEGSVVIVKYKNGNEVK